MKQILMVDDDTEFIELIKERLSPHGKKRQYKIIGCSLPSEAEALVKKCEPDLMLLDIDFGAGLTRAGLEILKTLRKDCTKTKLPIIILTGIGDDNRVLEQAFKFGANDCVQKPPVIEELLQKIVSLTEVAPSPLPRLPEEEYLVGKSMIKITNEIIKTAHRSMDVLFVGESGTGKEIASKIYHRNSPRSHTPLVVVNCPVFADLFDAVVYGYRKGAYSGADHDQKGLVEEANGGILFFDEISCLKFPQQNTLLRFLEDKKFRPLGGEEQEADVIILAATNCNLKEMVRQGRFKEDLYSRFNRYVIEIPPLRERKGDIELLARHFMEKYNDKNIREINDELLKIFARFPWPRNVRQLKNCIKNGIQRCEGKYLSLKDVQADLDEISDSSDPAAVAMPEIFRRMDYKAFKQYLEDENKRLEAQFYSYHLSQHRSIARTAKALGMRSSQYLHQILKKLGINTDRNSNV